MSVALQLTDQGRERRIARFTRSDDRLFLVPLDHSVAMGPIADAERLRALTRILSESGVDGVIVHKGRARFLAQGLLRTVGLIVHLNGSTTHSTDSDEKVLLAGVEEALRAGADGVSVHVNIGSCTEAHQLGDLGAVAGACSRWSLPLLAMVYPRGPRIVNPCEPSLVSHAANLAADLGADIVKVSYTGDPHTMADVVASCPIPIVAAGGDRLTDGAEVYSLVREVMSSGVNGMAVGRNVFQAADVGDTASRIASIVHPLDGAADRERNDAERVLVGSTA